MATRIPIFRKVTHPELEKLGMTGGVADHAFLALAAANTNQLIREKRHIPPIRQTHRGRSDGLALGATVSAETDGVTLFGEIDLNDLGRDLVGKKQLRTVSVSFRRDFPLNGGSDGGTLPGPYVHHVAFLGDELPAIKGLVDLAEVAFSDGESSGWITHDDLTGEVTYFAEFNPSTSEEESDQMNEKEMQAQIDKLAADFAEEKTKREAAEAEVAKMLKVAADAKKAEFSASVTSKINAAAAAGKLTAEKAIELTALGERAFGNADAEAIFAELVANVAPANVPTTPIPADPKVSTVTKADFDAATAGDMAASAKVSAAFYEAKSKDASLTHTAFMAQFAE